MNYFYSDGNSGVMGPYSKEEIIGFYRQKIVSPETTICAEGTQEWYSIATILPKNETPVSPPQQISKTILSPPLTRTVPRWTDAVQAKNYLQHIRTNTCYSALRTVITILAAVTFLGVCVTTLGLLALGSATGGDTSGLAYGYAIAEFTFGTAIVIAVRQAALLFVDLVDAQIEKNARM